MWIMYLLRTYIIVCVYRDCIRLDLCTCGSCHYRVRANARLVTVKLPQWRAAESVATGGRPPHQCQCALVRRHEQTRTQGVSRKQVCCGVRLLYV